MKSTGPSAARSKYPCCIFVTNGSHLEAAQRFTHVQPHVRSLKHILTHSESAISNSEAEAPRPERRQKPRHAESRNDRSLITRGGRSDTAAPCESVTSNRHRDNQRKGKAREQVSNSTCPAGFKALTNKQVSGDFESDNPSAHGEDNEPAAEEEGDNNTDGRVWPSSTDFHSRPHGRPSLGEQSGRVHSVLTITIEYEMPHFIVFQDAFPSEDDRYTYLYNALICAADKAGEDKIKDRLLNDMPSYAKHMSKIVSAGSLLSFILIC